MLFIDVKDGSSKYLRLLIAALITGGYAVVLCLVHPNREPVAHYIAGVAQLLLLCWREVVILLLVLIHRSLRLLLTVDFGNLSVFHLSLSLLQKLLSGLRRLAWLFDFFRFWRKKNLV